MRTAAQIIKELSSRKPQLAKSLISAYYMPTGTIKGLQNASYLLGSSKLGKMLNALEEELQPGIGDANYKRVIRTLGKVEQTLQEDMGVLNVIKKLLAEFRSAMKGQGYASATPEIDRFLSLAALSDEAQELLLYTQNDGDIYRQRVQPIEKNLEKKWKSGKYDHNLAWKIWMYALEDGAKKYIKEHGSPGDVWSKMFPKKDRIDAAKQWADEWKDEAEVQHGPMGGK